MTDLKRSDKTQFRPRPSVRPQAETAPSPGPDQERAAGSDRLQRMLRSGAVTPPVVLGQQRTIGNRAVQRLLRERLARAGASADRVARTPVTDEQLPTLAAETASSATSAVATAVRGPAAGARTGASVQAQRAGSAGAPLWGRPRIQATPEGGFGTRTQRAQVAARSATLWARPDHHPGAAGAFPVGAGYIQRFETHPSGGIKIDSLTFNPKELAADGASTSQAAATTTPAGREVKWRLRGVAAGSSIESNTYGSAVDKTGLITAGKQIQGGKESHKLYVIAADAKTPAAFAFEYLTVLDGALVKARQDFTTFSGGTYSLPNFKKGLNGKFDVEYHPAAKRLDIKMRLKFQFVGKGWKQANKQAYIANYLNQVDQAWGGRYTFKNVRQPQGVWGKLNPVRVKLNLTEVKSGQHFTIRASKGTGGAQVDQGVTKFYKGDEATESPFYQADVLAGETARLASINPSPVLFGRNSAAFGAAAPNARADLTFMAKYLSRINVPRFEIKIVGHTATTGSKVFSEALSKQRAQAVEGLLKGGGAGNHNLVTSWEGDTGMDKTAASRKVTVTPSIPAGFVNEFKTMPHEFGHMLGLGDLYKTPTAKALATHHELVTKAFGAKYADLVAKRGASPVTAGQSAEVMDVGVDVRIHDYVTIWSGLVEATLKAPVPAPPFGYGDWKFAE